MGSESCTRVVEGSQRLGQLQCFFLYYSHKTAATPVFFHHKVSQNWLTVARCFSIEGSRADKGRPQLYKRHRGCSRLCQNAVKEMKDAKEIEMEQQQRWSQMVEERLQSLQQGLNANANNIKRLDDLDVPSTLGRLKQTRSWILEELVVDFEEHSEKLHTLEEQNEKLKLQLDQMRKSNASDLEALQQYCRVSVYDLFHQVSQVIKLSWLLFVLLHIS
ncbi:hypothetical protein GOP47_0027107 [Adiantum capillus-veneris]|nr:hypothetical protein GOP47_0027107 [Adiantum capillus-veneris]